jgi:hypothetical protein
MFRLEGRVHSNGEGTSGGGAAGGSIIVRSLNFDGEGSLEVNGGTGGGRSGGGGGGRLAVYYTGNNTYIGSYQAFGGSSSTEKGGAGTIYIEDRKNISNPYRTLRVNNGVPRTRMLLVGEIKELVLTGNSLQTLYATSYQSPSGVTVSTTGSPHCLYVPHRDCTYNPSNLGNLLASTSSYYFTAHSSPVITYQFPVPFVLEYLLIYPACVSGYNTKHFVRVYHHNNVVVQSRDWVDTSHCLQGQPGRVDVHHMANKVTFKLTFSLQTHSKLKWAFPFCEKYDQICAVSLIFFIIQV